jgi:hypothetical protein
MIRYGEEDPALNLGISSYEPRKTTYKINYNY